jgi:hypothetical protein
MSDSLQSRSVVILLAWFVLGIPLGWGIYNTLLNSVKLFQTH